MTKKSNPPSTTLTAFDCPHCGAYATQQWFTLYAEIIDGEYRTPRFPSEQDKEYIYSHQEIDSKAKESIIRWMEKIQSGLTFIGWNHERKIVYSNVGNLHVSECFNCKKVSVWAHKTLVFPSVRVGDLPNSDLPDDIIRDIEEARSILNESPRGAAALLRLAIQKLCKFLGEGGKNIDSDIASLVKKGLSSRVQQSLDIVRVIGNEAVHPGVLDLRDDRDTVLKLLKLVNIIAEQMISQPKTIQEMYDQLPQSKLKSIENRDKKSLKNNQNYH